MTKFLFVMTKGFEKAGGATRAFQFAAIAVEKGHPVEVFLIDDAVHWAQLGMAEGIRSTTGEHLKDLLDKLTAAKTPIHVCEACASKRMIDIDDLVPGSQISSGSLLVDKMVDPEYKVFTF